MVTPFFDWLFGSASGHSESPGFVESVERFFGIGQKKRELAWTVILVDMASIDNDFSPRESYTIKQRLQDHLGVSYDEAVGLVEKAIKIIDGRPEEVKNFRSYLKEHLSRHEKEELLELLDEIISDDGHVHPFEQELRTRFIRALHLEEGDGE